jgi:hypothetical protein
VPALGITALMGTDFTVVQATGIGVDTATVRAIELPFMRTSDTRLRSTMADTTLEAFAARLDSQVS